jgi:hypothetical protein
VHLRLIKETRERNRGNAALTVGTDTLTRGCETMGNALSVVALDVTAQTALPSMSDLVSMIAHLQEQLCLQTTMTAAALPVDDSTPYPQQGLWEVYLWSSSW